MVALEDFEWEKIAMFNNKMTGLRSGCTNIWKMASDMRIRTECGKDMLEAHGSVGAWAEKSS